MRITCELPVLSRNEDCKGSRQPAHRRRSPGQDDHSYVPSEPAKNRHSGHGEQMIAMKLREHSVCP
jgi:hypothetical protein